MPSSEASALLRHPNPVERSMALKLDSITPAEVARSCLDPHPLVWEAAFYHPQSALALEVLAASSRDAAGNPIHDRHDKLLKDPRCQQHHIEAMHRAVAEDGYLPIKEQSSRLKEISSKLDLKKKESPQIELTHTPDQKEGIVKSSQEPYNHPELHQIYEKAVNSKAPIAPQDADLHDPGKASPKVVYHADKNKFLVKPYLEKKTPLSGWSESSSQELYKAAGIPHLHQKSFTAAYKSGNDHIPATVIHIEEATPVHKVSKGEVLNKNPNVADEARQIGVMDFLTGNADRNSNNLMIRPNGKPLAIDHGLSFSYNGSPDIEGSYQPKKKNVSHLGKYSNRATALLTHAPLADEDFTANKNDIGYHNTIKNWWPGVSPDVKRAFEDRLHLITNPITRKHLEAGFNARHQWLDEAAKKEPEVFLQDLKKAVSADTKLDPVIEPSIAQTDSDKKKFGRIHTALLTAHPKKLQENVDSFERNINNPNSIVKPLKGDLDGIEHKSLVKHGTQKYLLKGANTEWNPYSAWSELGSQKLYNSAGIPELHQDVHATKLHIKQGDNLNTQDAIAIHFKPGKWQTLSELQDKSLTKLKKFREEKAPELRKIYLMDFLQGQGDRHDQNLLIGPNNQVQAIDNSFAFKHDNQSNPKDQEEETEGLGKNKAFNWNHFNNNNAISFMGHQIDAKTHAWWLQNKKNIVDAFNEHLDLLPDKQHRDNIRANFNHRVAAVDNKHPAVYYQPVETLKKTLGNASFLHDVHSSYPEQKSLKVNTQGLHEALMKAHPAKVNPAVRHFEIAINGAKNPVKPIKSQAELGGMQQKGVYASGAHSYMVKPALEASTALGAFNELGSQAIYHAAGVGHLHQGSHCSIGKTGENRSEPAEALVVHMSPNGKTYADAMGYTYFDKGTGKNVTVKGQDEGRASKMLYTPEHLQSLKKIGLLGYLTNNVDQHIGNLLVGPNGEPMQIDASRSFFADRKHAFGPEHEGERDFGELMTPDSQHEWIRNWKDWQKQSDPADLAGPLDQDTWDWYDSQKGNILDAFKKHVNLLPSDPPEKKRMINSFQSRLNRLESNGDLRKSSLQTTKPNVESKIGDNGEFEQTLDVQRTDKR